MRLLGLVLASLSLVACGGGGGGSSGNAGNAANAGVAATGALTGVAAVGAGIQGHISVLDAAGHSRALDTADGSFRFNLAGMQSPLLLKAQWTDAQGSHRLYSFASSDGVANITPLTDLAVSAAAAASPDALFSAPNSSAFARLQSALPGSIARLQTLLQPLLHRYAVASSNPITEGFRPDHTGMDALLDSLSVRYLGGNVTLLDKASGAILLDVPLADLARAVSSSGWGTADASRTSDMDAALSASGQGLVCWIETVNGQQLLKARQLDGVATPHTLSLAGDAAQPRLGIDAAGNAIVVWTQSSATQRSIWSARRSAASGQWSAAQQLSAAQAPGDADLPDLALDAAGNAIAVWQQADSSGLHQDGWAAQYASASDRWSAAALVTDGVHSAHGLRVALHASGRGLLAWQQAHSPALTSDIAARPVSTTAPWGNSSLVGSSGGQANAAYVYGRLALAVNGTGGGGVLWSQRQTPGQPMQMQSALYSPSAGWQASGAIGVLSNDDCHDPQLAFDGAGNAVAVWQQQTDYGAYGASNRYLAGVGWGIPTPFVDSRLGDTIAPALSLDSQGNASVVWYRWAAGNVIDVMITRNSGQGWALPQVFSPVGSYSTLTHAQPRVVNNGQGQTLVVWGVRPSA
jgi:hypothetical protein